MNRLVSILIALIVLVFSLAPASAHRPRLERELPLTLSDGRQATIHLLYGEGIFFADPVQAVIVDDEGWVVAATPESDLLYLFCDEPLAYRCLVYDADARKIYAPEENRFRRLKLAEENGAAAFYPTDTIASGFSRADATFVQMTRFEIRDLFRNNATLWGFLILGSWMTFVAFVFASVFTRPKSKNAAQVYFWIAATLLKLAALLLLLFVTAYMMALSGDVSEFRFWLATTLGGLVVAGTKFAVRRTATLPPGST